VTRRALLLLALVALVVLGIWKPWDVARELETDVRRDMFLDLGNVELLEGFPEHTPLMVWPDFPRPNIDRDQVAIVPFTRSCRMRWHVWARPGRFSARAARLQLGKGGDASDCRIIVRIVGSGEPAEVEVEIPPVSPDLFAEDGVLREGPYASFSLAMPRGAQTLEIEVQSEGEIPPGSYVTLLSPRVLQQPARVLLEGHPLEFDRDQRLTAAWTREPADEVPFAQRRTAAGDETDVTLAPVDIVGSFTGRMGRHALALTGAAARFTGEVDIESRSVLRGSLALDDRMPPGTRAQLVCSVDGEELARLDVDSVDWVEFELPLDGHVGEGRQVSLALEGVRITPAWTARSEPNAITGTFDAVEYRARNIRVGIAGPRVATPVSVPRRQATPESPSVVLIQIETLRSDLLDPFGGVAPGLTPNLQRLAGRSIVYEHAVAPSPWTLPTTATLFTGLPPSAHGVVDHDRAVLPDGVTTLAEHARDEGVVTGGFVTNTLLSDHAGYGRGFETYAMLPYRNARQVNAFADGFLENHVGQQFLLFLHYFDPHHPTFAPGDRANRYVEPELRDMDVLEAEARIVERLRAGLTVPTHDPDVRYLRQRYMGEIAWLDEQLGLLLANIDRMGLSDTTTIVITADHGEEFLEHGLLGHSFNLHAETTRVPLMVTPVGALSGFADREPSPVEPERVREVVGTGGLFARVLDELRVSYEPDEVLPALAPSEYAFIETNKGLALDGKGDPLRRPLRAIRSDTHLLVWSRPVEGEEGDGTMCLYDLVADPEEQNPMAAVGPAADLHRRWMEEIGSWIADHQAEAPTRGTDDSQIENLRNLGYVGGGHGGGLPVSPCDP